MLLFCFGATLHQGCAELTSDSAFRDHSRRCVGAIGGTGDWTWVGQVWGKHLTCSTISSVRKRCFKLVPNQILKNEHFNKNPLDPSCSSSLLLFSLVLFTNGIDTSDFFFFFFNFGATPGRAQGAPPVVVPGVTASSTQDTTQHVLRSRNYLLTPKTLKLSLKYIAPEKH